jgi:hypothetical protein
MQASSAARVSFDLIEFSTEEDYLCYIEAVQLLYKNNTKKLCDFVYNKTVFNENIH